MLTLLPIIREARALASRRYTVAYWVSTGRYAHLDPIGFEQWKSVVLPKGKS